MKLTYYFSAILSVILLFTLSACSDSGTGSPPGELTGESVEFDLKSVGDSSIDGKVLFEERIDGFTRVTITLNGLDEGTDYTVQFYTGTTLDEGDPIIELDHVEGSSGEIVQVLSADAEGNTITYEDLLEIDAHLRVYEVDDTGTTLAVIDIGKNALTGEVHEFEFEEVNSSGVHGNVEFHERVSGKILAVIYLEGSADKDEFVAKLYEKDEENVNPLFEFNPFDSESGLSKTNMAEFENDSSVEFEELEALLYIYNEDMVIVSQAKITHENNSEYSI